LTRVGQFISGYATLVKFIMVRAAEARLRNIRAGEAKLGQVRP